MQIECEVTSEGPLLDLWLMSEMQAHLVPGLLISLQPTSVEAAKWKQKK